MIRSRRLELGAAVLATLTLACFVGPLVMPQPPPADPARAALLPPGTEVTVVESSDGRTFASPRVEDRGSSVVVTGHRRDVELRRSQVVSINRHRYWLGTDRFGRDVLSSLLIGGRISLSVAASAALISLLIGTSCGLAAATGGRWLDAVLMRAVDGLLAFPVLFLLILVATLFRPGPLALVVVLGLTSWMGLSRLVRGQVLSLRSRPFILAARAAGSTPTRIWRLHYLPNLAGPVSQDTALRLGDLVLAEATLSFLGLGIPPDLPTWGGMVAQGHRVMIQGWWLATIPGLAIAALVISLALIGDGIQQRLAIRSR
jgi:peptide/nickel transport system permease protein